MSTSVSYRLEGLEPDNLLAFLAVLGLLRVLEAARPEWRARVGWTVGEPPLRPLLRVSETTEKDSIVSAVAEGLEALVSSQRFAGSRDLSFSPEDARAQLIQTTDSVEVDRYGVDLWAALLSDAAVSRDGKKAQPTPLCLLHGQGHQHFLERLDSVPLLKAPPERGSGRSKTVVSESDSLHEALFSPWERPDSTPSFRWDPHEDVRYAYRARDPTDGKTKETTQHGANRLAAIGISVLTVVPRARGARVDLAIVGGRKADGAFLFRWPIWRAPISLSGVKALLGHPGLDKQDVRTALGVVEMREAKRVSAGKFMNFSRGVSSLDV